MIKEDWLEASRYLNREIIKEHQRLQLNSSAREN
jgi:hypothetical protein